jgi:putative membrane protein
MIHLLVRWLVSAVSLLIVAYVVPGFHVHSFGAAMIAALVIGFVNGTLGAILKFVTWPFRILTLGLLTWVIDAAMLLLAAKFTQGFQIDGWFAALIGALLLALVSGLLHTVTGGSKK